MRTSIIVVLAIVLLGAVLIAAAPRNSNDPKSAANAEGAATATFAGGCFWCMEPPFDAIDGVFSTTSGYVGGPEKNPTYEQVSSGRTGHTEAVEIRYDPTKVSYGELLEVFWKNIDPTTANRQFCDRGPQYRSAIFFHDEEQKALAQASLSKIEESGVLDKPVVTQLIPATPFYAAEEYHQDYYKKNPVRYKLYRTGCGRDRVLKGIWGSAPH